MHDTFSSFYPLAAASKVIARMDLESYGLRWRHAPAVLGHPLPDGSWALLQRDVEETAAGLEALPPGDGDAWRALHREWQRMGPVVVDGLLRPFPPVRTVFRALPRLPRVGGLSYVRQLLTPAVSLATQRFRGEAARLLLVGNALHADLPLTGSGSGLFGLLLAMLGQTTGFVVPEGGAQQITSAFVRRLQSRGGEVRTGALVSKIVVRERRARGVLVEDELIEAEPYCVPEIYTILGIRFRAAVTRIFCRNWPLLAEAR